MTSPSLMHGYYRDTDEDGDGLIIDESGTRCLRTGDLGELDQDGFLYLRGRIKRIYLAKGRNNSIYKLFPDRVERVILKCPYVLECAVVVKSADGIFHVPVAFAAVQECTVDQIQRYCKDHLPEYMIPEDIRIIDHIAAPIRSGDVCILFVYFPYFSLYAFIATASISIAREMSSAFMV